MEPTAETGSARQGEEKGEVTAEEPEGLGRQAATAPPMARWERGMRQDHPEGLLRGQGRFTAPAALLPSSLNAFLVSLQSLMLIASAAPKAAEQQYRG